LQNLFVTRRQYGHRPLRAMAVISFEFDSLVLAGFIQRRSPNLV
jgi:hypothetical protein